MPKATALNDDDKEALNAWFDALSSEDQAAFLLGKHMVEAARVALKDLCASTISLANARNAKIKGVMFLKTTRGTEEQRETARAKAQEQVMKNIELSKSQTDRKRKLREELIASGREVPMTAFNKKMKAAREEHRASGAPMATFKPNEQRRTKCEDDGAKWGVDEKGKSNTPKNKQLRQDREDDGAEWGVDEKGKSNTPKNKKRRGEFGFDIDGKSLSPVNEAARKLREANQLQFGYDSKDLSLTPANKKARTKYKADRDAGKISARELALQAAREIEMDLRWGSLEAQYGGFDAHPLCRDV
jgi:hypothetical protein